MSLLYLYLNKEFRQSQLRRLHCSIFFKLIVVQINVLYIFFINKNTLFEDVLKTPQGEPGIPMFGSGGYCVLPAPALDDEEFSKLVCFLAQTHIKVSLFLKTAFRILI